MTFRIPAIAHVLCDPRRLFVLATLLLVAGLVASYVTISNWAERTLALRQGPPPAVALQAFDRARHEGPADEVVIWAEADLASPLVVAIADRSPARRLTVFPLYRVSDIGAAAILAARGDAAHSRLGAAPQENAAAAGPPLGLMVFDHAERAMAAVDPLEHATALGAGRYGSVLEINGIARPSDDVAAMPAGRLGAGGAALPDSLLVVAPYLEGRFATLRYGAPVSAVAAYFLWPAGALILAALVLSLFGHGAQDGIRDLPDGERAAGAGRSAAPSWTARFEPLPSQEEVSADERPTRHAFVVGELAGVLRRIRSPR